MSRQEAGANASSLVAASQQVTVVSQVPERRSAEEANQRSRGGQRAAGGGGWRGPPGLQQPVVAGFQEPPLSFRLKNDWVGVVIGESRRRVGPGRGLGEGIPTPPTSPPISCHLRRLQWLPVILLVLEWWYSVHLLIFYRDDVLGQKTQTYEVLGMKD